MLAAARQLDYARRSPEAHRVILRIEVTLVRPEARFFFRLAGAFERLGAMLDPLRRRHRTFVPEDDPAAIAARIAKPGLRRAGLILAVPDVSAIRVALGQMQARGLPIVQIVTRATGVVADCVGIDNEAAGRVAGLLLSRMQPRAGTVVAICYGGAYQMHRDRIRGFSGYLQAHPRPDLRSAQVLSGHDRGARSCCSTPCGNGQTS
ncbi:Transcriptional regulator, LacI family [Rubellimicrobium mesophilum DSM 19309]|uniref:Transcriptional regulator, LacI family n=1 Tax=Rubellimicrobium mesophilum DSM 19309 TaxID=442562 RepID=A0A017HSC1_9RHOB|nr:Transcriptional regulator, LacI family [Rubellimicrobium mesophilum DSM 19309]